MMRPLAAVGPYRLSHDKSLGVAREIQQTDEPPSFHLSWLPVPGVAFAMHVVEGRASVEDEVWHPFVMASHLETVQYFEAAAAEDIDGTLGPGTVFQARRLADLGRYEGDGVVEHYVGEAYDDIVVLTYRFHGEQMTRADSWRLLFHTMVFSAIIARGNEMAARGQLPPAARIRKPLGDFVPPLPAPTSDRARTQPRVAAPAPKRKATAKRATKLSTKGKGEAPTRRKR